MSTLKTLPYGDKAILIPEGKLVRLTEETYLPTAESNLAAWYRASSLSLADAASVASWADESGNSPAGERNLLQATGGNQPVYDINGGPNNHACVTFNGTSSKMKTAAFTLNRPWHVFIVAKLNGWTANDTVFDGNSINTARFYQKTATPQLTMYCGATMFNYLHANDPTGTPAWEIYEVSNGDYPRIVSGNQQILNGTLDDCGTNNPGGFTLGADGSGANYCSMDVAEILIFSEECVGTKLKRIRQFLSDEYNLPAHESNLISSSRDLSDTNVWTPGRSAVGSNYVVCHDGQTRNALELVEDGTASQTHYIKQGTLPLVPGEIYKVSCYVKQGVTTAAGRCAGIGFHDTDNGWNTNYVIKSMDLNTPSNGVLSYQVTGSDGTLESGFEEADYGWYKIWSICQANASIISAQYPLLLMITDENGVGQFSGNGTSSVYFDDIKIERVA